MLLEIANKCLKTMASNKIRCFADERTDMLRSCCTPTPFNTARISHLWALLYQNYVETAGQKFSDQNDIRYATKDIIQKIDQ